MGLGFYHNHKSTDISHSHRVEVALSLCPMMFFVSIGRSDKGRVEAVCCNRNYEIWVLAIRDIAVLFGMTCHNLL